MANKRIGVLTAGGDAPGMNAAIRAVVRTGIYCGYEIIGFKCGFDGLLEGDYVKMTSRSVSGIINMGGTILHTGRTPEMRTEVGINKAVKVLKELDIYCLVGIGGDGTLAGCNALAKKGINVVHLPGTIDNDISGTDDTIGFDTAVNTAVDAIDKIRDTAKSHNRVFVVEIMGRHHGFLTLAVGVAAGCEIIAIPEYKLDIEELCDKLRRAREMDKKSLIIAYAEGCGDSNAFAKEIAQKTGLDVRVSNIGYIQRGGAPTARTRIVASMMGAAAIQLIKEEKFGLTIGTKDGKINSNPIETILSTKASFTEKDLEAYKMLQKLSI